MTITIRQYQKIYNKHLLAVLKEGRVPSFEEVVARAGNELPSPEQPVAPTYKYVPQVSGGEFDIDLYNRSVRNILTDISILFEELTDIEINNIQRVLHANLFNGVHAYELAKLNKELDALLFALQGADDNFFAVFDSFNDLSKTDTVNSTPGIVSLDEGCISLPISTQGTFKIDLSSLYNVRTSNATISSEAATIVGNVPGTFFGNIFRDSNTAWGIIVEAPSNGKIDLSFKFALSEEDFVNKITLLHHGQTPQTAFVSTSVDGFNIKPILEYSEGVQLVNQTEVKSLDFADTLVEYVYITLSKNQADSVISADGVDTFQYIFGLKNISLYTTGRGEEGTYYSEVFDFSSDTPSISSIAISSDEKLPDGTAVDWQVALVDSNDNQIGSYMPITPQSRALGQGPSQIVKVHDVVLNSQFIISSDSSYVNVFDFNSIDFYNIYNLTSKPIFGTASLFRGLRSWFRDSTGNFQTALVKDNFVPFSKGPVQNLYAVKQEIATVKTVGNNTSKRVVLVTNSPLYDDNGSFILVPPRGINTDKDTSPNYAVYNVSLSSGPVSAVKSNVSFSSGDVDLGQSNIIYQQVGDIVIREVVTTAFGPHLIGDVLQEFVDGRDYIVELNSDNTPTGKIILTTGSPLYSTPPANPNSQYKISYTIDPDITRFVSSITNNQIFFDVVASNANVITDQQVVVKYRFVPTNILKSSIKVKAYFGLAGDSKVYRQGVDYIFDTLTSTVQRLTTGSIDSDKDVYVDYKFNTNTSQVHQFFLWAYISSNVDPIQTKTLGSGSLDNQNTLLPDTAKGESLSANIPGLGLIELTNAIQWPKMTGWVQFIVKSIPPETLIGTTQVPLINQVIAIKDRQNDYIFVKGGKYFSELTGIREPLRQVSLPFLKTNVLKNDRSNFAIREVLGAGTTTYQVIVNFQPNTTTELYQFSVDPTTGTVIANSEEWKLTWSTNESSNAFTKVKVKAVLTRSKTTNGNITPKVFSYYLKVSI